MTQGLFTAVSGIRANQTKLNVISNNIANVNTLGFKSSLANFATVFTSTFSGGTAPNGTLGGTNPLQQGNGTMVSEIASNWGQGGAQFTGRSTDLMLNGNGFFAVERLNTSGSASTDYYLTRAGNFTLDSNGNMVTSSGNRLRGTSQMDGSNVTTLGRVNIPLTMNVCKDIAADGSTVLGIHMGDTSSVPADFAAAGVITAGTASQQISTTHLSSFSIGQDGSITAIYDNGDRISVRADATTQAAAVAAGDPTLARTQLVYQSGTNTFAYLNTQAGVDAGKLDQLAAKSVFDGGVNNPPAGLDPMQGMQMQLQVATVTNNAGLLYDGNNNYLPGANSGSTNFGVANTGARGGISTGALESSNVDLAGEFTNMVIAQRGLEASSKVVRAESEVMQTIIQMV